MADEDQPQPENRQASGGEGKRFSEAAEIVQVAVTVAAPVIGAVAGAVTNHVLNNKPADSAPPPPTIELPPGVHKANRDQSFSAPDVETMVRRQ